MCCIYDKHGGDDCGDDYGDDHGDDYGDGDDRRRKARSMAQNKPGAPGGQKSVSVWDIYRRIEEKEKEEDQEKRERQQMGKEDEQALYREVKWDRPKDARKRKRKQEEEQEALLRALRWSRYGDDNY